MKPPQGNVIVIGNFDGFHLGHQEILKNAKKIAEKEEMDLILLTFDPNPKIFFGIESSLIFTCEEKIDFLKKEGINKIECLDFKIIHNLTGFSFVKKYLIEKYKMRYMLIGDDFHFGKGKQWNLEKLISVEDKYGFKVVLIPSVLVNGRKVSSSKIRELLRIGKVFEANKMLGHNYTVSGVVEKGEKIGTRLGFPTINISDRNSLLPNGVFETKTEFRGQLMNSVTYIGNNPTFGKDITKIETHIIDYKNDIYGERVKIYFIRKLRNEKKFKTGEDLIRQIKSDIEALNIDK